MLGVTEMPLKVAVEAEKTLPQPRSESKQVNNFFASKANTHRSRGEPSELPSVQLSKVVKQVRGITSTIERFDEGQHEQFS